MVDLRNIIDSPLRIRDDATLDQLGDAMKLRHDMINALIDLATGRLKGEEISSQMFDQFDAAIELLNNEIDAMERILVEH
jgi:ribosome-interacting GTPase 1